MVDRISTFSSHQNILRDVTNVQESLFKTQAQISSGKKSREFAGFDGQVELFINFEANIRKIQSFEEKNLTIQTRLETTSQALDQIVQVADDIENLITLRRNPGTKDNLAFETQINAMRNQISTLLNTDVAGRYIFSGTRTDVPPIIDKPLPAPLTLGVPDTTYYQGSNQDITTRISENSDMTYNVRADASGFQKIYAGVAHALDGHARNNDTVLQESFNLLRQGIDEVIATQTEVNANRITLEETNTHHLSLKLYFQSVTEDIANTDILAATTQSATDRAVLQASFQIFAKLNNLRLSDFL